MMDRELAAQKIRTRLEDRIAQLLGCEPDELPRLKLGALIHTAFLLEGTQETIGGFHTTMRAVLDLVGNELVWDIETKETIEEKKAEVIN